MIKYIDRYGNTRTDVKLISFDYFSPEGGVLEKVVLTDWICKSFIEKVGIIELENAISEVIVIDPKNIVSNIEIVS